MLKDIVDSKNLTCYKLAKLSGLSYTAINEIYRGERTIDECSVATAKKLANALKMDINSFLEKCEEKNAIPKKLYKCFWDVDYKQLDVIKHKTYIITRLLDKGGYDGFIFIKKTYTYEEIKEVAMKSRNFSPKIASFLKNICHLKDTQMNYYVKNVQDWRK